MLSRILKAIGYEPERHTDRVGNWPPMARPLPKAPEAPAPAPSVQERYVAAVVVSYTAKPGDTLFLIPSRPIAPDVRRALSEQLRDVPTLKGVEVVVLPSEFRVEGRSA